MKQKETSLYQPSLLFKYHHFNTIYPAFFRKIKINLERERLELDDGDFIDIDWSRVNSKKLVLVLHGLEGSTQSSYLRGMIRMFNQNGWDGVGMNFRGCSGEPNRLLRTYHSGSSDDLETVLQLILKNSDYEKVALVGFSLGGNVVLKYLGERGNKIDERIKYGIGISVPCDLAGCTTEIVKPHNYIYLNQFLYSLKLKTKTKMKFADRVDIEKVLQSKDFADFDNHFTAPVHGFESAQDYWTKCSSKQFLNNISIPSMMINAKDDSFLSETCYPFEEAMSNPNFQLLAPNYGGHVGFVQKNKSETYWTEEQVMEFINRHEF